MDPKMDSGCLAPGETLEDDYDVLRDLLPEEVVGIIDQLLCAEVRGRHLQSQVFNQRMSSSDPLRPGIMVHGPSPLANTVLLSVYRPSSMARAQKS